MAKYETAIRTPRAWIVFFLRPEPMAMTMLLKAMPAIPPDKMPTPKIAPDQFSDTWLASNISVG